MYYILTKVHSFLKQCCTYDLQLIQNKVLQLICQLRKVSWKYLVLNQLKMVHSLFQKRMDFMWVIYIYMYIYLFFSDKLPPKSGWTEERIAGFSVGIILSILAIFCLYLGEHLKVAKRICPCCYLEPPECLRFWWSPPGYDS
jgi:hypothetical protein